MSSFLGGKLRGLLADQCSKTIVQQFGSFEFEKKYEISINGKKMFKRILSCLFGGRRKVQVTKFALIWRTSSLWSVLLLTRSAH